MAADSGRAKGAKPPPQAVATPLQQLLPKLL
jgi:hypothetical protein